MKLLNRLVIWVRGLALGLGTYDNFVMPNKCNGRPCCGADGKPPPGAPRCRPFLSCTCGWPKPCEIGAPPVPPNSSLISRYNSTKSWVRNGKCAPWFKVMPPLAHAEGDKWIVHSNGEWTNTHGLGDWQVGLVSSFMSAAAARRNCILSSPRAFLWTVP